MTDRTLSAAELDAIATRTVFQQRNDWSVGGKWSDWVEVSPTERDALVDMARRTEAAERKVAKVEAIANSKTLLSGPWATKLDDIRRALAED